MTLAFSSQPPERIYSNPHFPPVQGCFEHIGHAIDSYTWGISWFGFAILMWTVRGREPIGWVGCGCGAEALLTRLPSPPAPCDADSHVFLHHTVRNEKGWPCAHLGHLLHLRLLPSAEAWLAASPFPFHLFTFPSSSQDLLPGF